MPSKPKPLHLLLSQNPKNDLPSLFSNLNSLLFLSTNPNSDSILKSNPKSVFLSISLNPNSTSGKPNLKSLPNLDRALIGAAAGAIAGAFTYVALLPLDAVKTNLQTKSNSLLNSSSLEVAASIFRNHGLLGFYKGISAVIVGSATSSAIYFGTCELGKALLSRIEGFPTILVPPTAGAMGNVVSSAVMVPKELITQRMQAGAATGRSWQVLVQILEKDGILGLYAGYSATLLRNLPAGILSYSSFEYLKAFALSVTGQPNLEPAQSVCCGALAGAISATLTTPLDVVKTRLMTQTQGEVRTKVFETMKQIVMEEGWGGLARGIGPRVLHSALFAALGYCAFETARLAIMNHYLQHRVKTVVDEVTS